MAAITLEELLEKVGVCPEKLNDCISDDHFLKISMFLTSWRTVAPFLGIKGNHLEDIEQENDEQVKRLNVLQKWKGILGYMATYRKLVEVLLSLAKADVAEKVCDLLKATEDVPVHVSVNSDSIKLQSSSREPESSDENTVNCTNAGLTHALTVQSSFQKLNPNDRIELLSKLYDDEKSMTHEFASLVTATCYSVQERVQTDLFCLSILSLKAYEPAPGERDRSLLDEHSREIKVAKSNAEIFAVLTPYWNYLNYEILEYIIKNHGTSEDCEKLEKYEDKLKNFCERRIFELPLLDNGSDIGKTFQNQAKFAIKLDKAEGIQGKELLRVRTQIAKILHVNVAAFVLCSVDTGCVQLTFLVPKFVSQEIFPLSCEQRSALYKDASVIRLECGDYVYKSTSKTYTEDAATQSTMLLEVLEDKSQLQKELCAEKPEETAQRQTSGATHKESSNAACFKHVDQATIRAKFADFQTKVCERLVKNGANIELVRVFVKDQFPPGNCIPPPPAGLIEIFGAITNHGLWDYFHYSPLVNIVRKFGANDSEMEGWVNTYKQDLKAYSITTKVEKFIESDLDVAGSPTKKAKYDPDYNTPVEWKTKFVDHSLQYLAEVWELFSSHYLGPDFPPTALCNCVREGCFLVTWLVPSYLTPQLIKRVKKYPDFCKQHSIFKVTVGDQCVYNGVNDESTLDDSRSGHGHEQLHPHSQPDSIAHTADEVKDFAQKKYVSVSVRKLLEKAQS